MHFSNEIAELATALAKAQGQIEDAAKDATNPHFKSKYADLAAVREAIRLPLSSNGIAYVQGVRSNGEGVEIETVLIHSSGQSIGETLFLPVQQRTPQSIGSAITYGKRYGLMGMLGLAASEDDDDGNAASGPAEPFRPVEVTSGVKEHKEPAVSSAAIAFGREMKGCTNLADLDSFKRTPEFKTAWGAMNEVDRKHIVATGEQLRAKLTVSDILMAGE